MKRHRFSWHTDPVFLLNLAWILALGVAVLYWIGSFTDYLATVVGVLGLGGIFTWTAFFLNMVREERKKELQSTLDDLLQLKGMSLFLLMVTVALLLVAWNLGCVIVDSRRDTLDRWIQVHPVGGQPPSRSTDLSVRAYTKFVVRTGFRGRDYVIDMEGLPQMVRHVRPHSHFHVKVPGDLLRCSMVLVQPSPEVAEYSAEPDVTHTLSVRIDGNDMGEIPFHGQTVWIGSGKSLYVPSRLQDRWRIELAANPGVPASTLFSWLEPDVYPSEKVRELKTGQKLEVTVQAPGAARPFARGAGVVAACRREEDFPQVLYLERVQ